MSDMAWLIIAVICGIIEVATMGFWFLWLALSALLVSFLTWLNVVTTLPSQVIVFSVITLFFVIFTRPLAVRVFKTNEVKSNVDALIGLTGIVTMEVVPPEAGQVRLQGEIWTARSDQRLNQDSLVRVRAVEGVTLYVDPVTEEQETEVFN
ncbi:MAG: NfeD family protein [Syntrophomonadaceae bacterium]|nr:NfeD family protein [Syntrophomonadaceae bacterium]